MQRTLEKRSAAAGAAEIGCAFYPENPLGPHKFAKAAVGPAHFAEAPSPDAWLRRGGAARQFIRPTTGQCLYNPPFLRTGATIEIMARIFEFIGNHPFLLGAFVLLLALFIRNEMQRGGRSVTAQQLVDLMNRDNALVLDVRDKKEFAAGHIVHAVNIPYAALNGRVDEIKKHLQRPIVVACKMGQHSGTAGAILRKHGFQNVCRLAGGIAEWRNQNLPVVKA